MSSVLLAQEQNKRTLLEKNEEDDEGSEVQYDPNVNRYDPSQDSAYFRALRLNIPLTTRFQYEMQFSDIEWELREKLTEGKSLQYAFKELQERYPDLLMPSAVDIVHRDIALERSFEIPFANTWMRHGARFNLQDIGRLLGITNDYRPEISYSLDFNAEVKVLVYSISASVVATIYDGMQRAGSYKFAWNGRDDNGKKMPKGDYIIEVRVGEAKYIRKRCILN
jgi:hypothetical protein